MKKNEFLKELEKRINKYHDHSEIISYYYELIQDKIDSGLDEEEAVESLGSLDEIVKAIESERETVKEEVTVKQAVSETKVENKGDVKSTEAKGMSGGKKFVYVLWTIATVCMCIVSISILIAAIAFLIATIAVMGSAFGVVFTSVAMGGFQFGIGLFLFGAAIVAVHYANVLVKFIFKHRPRWNSNVRKGLAGE